ncbi:MAG: TonB-dependent receptor [Armatimonadota bacterium]|nr:TonB-dependent receptor [Armatimonadota bacterium]MDR7549408.1 TonB-dependent receptor [Armatimonadota bacterium]
MRARVLLVFALCMTILAGLSSSSRAQEPPVFELPEVVSPGRRPQPAAASPASVSILTAPELRRLGVRTVGEAIAYLPETVARAYGGPGSLITPSIRGSSAEQVLVLLDGVPLNSLLAGTVDLSTIPIDDVERIEVLRGPFSAIHGSGALGGVISIVTRRQAAAAVSVGGGSLGVVTSSVTAPIAAGSQARISLRYDAAQGDRPNSDLRGGSLSLRLGETAPGGAWDLSLFGSTAARGAPGSTPFPSLTARQEDARAAGALTVQRTRAEVTDRLRLLAHHETLAFREPLFAIDDRHRATAWGAEWQRVVRITSARVVTLGTDVHLQHLTSTAVGDRSATVGAWYLQDDRALGARAVLSVGVRADWHSTYGFQVNPRVGVVSFVRPDLRLRAAAGRTFRGPTLADLYYPFDGFAVGNPSLRPEYAWSLDAGVEAALAPRLLVRATAFASEVADLILWVPDPSFVFSPRNIGTARIRGASVELEGTPAPTWTVRASSTWMAATDAGTGADLPNRPRLTGALALSRALPGGGSLTVSAVAVGGRFADAANTVWLPPYATAGVSAQVPLGTALLARATVQNLFDARYEPVQGYPAPGRTVLVEVLVRPQAP